MFLSFTRGYALLKSGGWRPGDGLGRDMSGICSPLKANFKYHGTGEGLEYPDWRSDFLKFLLDISLVVLGAIPKQDQGT